MFLNLVLESFQAKPEAIAFCGNVINSKPFRGLNNVIRKAFLFDHSSDDMTILPNFLATSFTKNPSESFEDERAILLKEANLLQKEKNKSSYKKDKHKKDKYDDGN